MLALGFPEELKRLCKLPKILSDLTALKLLFSFRVIKHQAWLQNSYWTCGLSSLKTKLSLCEGIFKGFLHREEQGRGQVKMLMVHTLTVLHFSETPLVPDQTPTPEKAAPHPISSLCLTSKLQRTRAPLLRDSQSKAENLCFCIKPLLSGPAQAGPAARTAEFLQLLYLVPAPAMPRLFLFSIPEISHQLRCHPWLRCLWESKTGLGHASGFHSHPFC